MAASEQQLVLREEDNNLVYKPTKQTTKSDTEITLFEKLLNSDEFKREPTKGIVIDEDSYLSHLEEIITRDYFPLLQEKKEKENKIANNEEDSILDPLVENLKGINKEYEETLKEKKTKKYDLSNVSLDSYLANFNSDELESFKDLQFQDKKKRLRKLLWIYEQSNYHNTKMFALKEYADNFMKLPTAEKKKFDTANINFALADPKNSLMFYANGNYKHPVEEDEIGKFSKNISSEIGVNKDNTRLPEGFVDEMMKKSAFNMRKTIFENYENSDHAKILREASKVQLDSLNKDSKNNDIKGLTPMINGYKLLKAPVPEPGEIDPIPLMTWGEIASTPMILKVGQNNKFTIPQTPQREKVAISLANKNAEKKNKKELKPNVKSIRSNLNTYEFTPNALKLLDSVKRSNNASVFLEPKSTVRLEKKGDLETDFLGKKRIGSSMISIKSTLKDTPKK